MPVPGVFEIVGLIASILDLAGSIRDLFTRIYRFASDSWVNTSGCQKFQEYLNLVENVVKPYMNPHWEENSAMRHLMGKVKSELETARNVVSGLLDANGEWRGRSPGEIEEKLEKSEASIQKFINLITLVVLANSQPREPHTGIAQDGHAHRGNEDLDRDYAYSVHLEELLGSSHQVHADEEFVRVLQESQRIGSTSHSYQSPMVNPQNTRSSYQVQEILGIGSTSHSNQSPMVNPQNTMSSNQVRNDEEIARNLQEMEWRWGSSQVEDDEEFARRLQAKLNNESPPKLKYP